MKEYKLLKWYPSLVNEWNTDTTVVVVAGFNEYRLHPSLNGVLRFAIVDKLEVENNEEYWQELVPNTYTTSDGQPIREGDKFYMYDDKYFKCIQSNFGHYTNKKYDGKRYKTQKEVEDLIELTKTQYSLKDIIRIANKLSFKLYSKEEVQK